MSETFDLFVEYLRLVQCFPGGYLTRNGEFVAHVKSNVYFILAGCESKTDIAVKMLAWFSRGAFKTAPYRTKKNNDKYHEFMLNGINQYLGTNFAYEDMERIYAEFGNMIQPKKLKRFVLHGYNWED